MAYPRLQLSDFEAGYFVGLLVGEGHFGGDQQQPQITVRMHTRHERVFDWLDATFPFGKLYGPYSGNGRVWYQWMARGPFLREQLIPFLDQFITPTLCDHVYRRYFDMKLRYGLVSPDGTIPRR